MADANASQPTIREISWTNALTSLEGVLFERSWLSLALRQGWFETWTFFGRVVMLSAAGDSRYAIEGGVPRYCFRVSITGDGSLHALHNTKYSYGSMFKYPYGRAVDRYVSATKKHKLR